MPIVDIELVCAPEPEITQVSAVNLADALGQVFASPPGHTWVRLRYLDCDAYAENQSVVGTDELPPRPPPPVEVRAITSVLASCLARSVERVHVQYAPAAACRQAFGGVLVA
ncbi:MAG: hypothetical protein IPO43_11620 [Rhodoferax sp.]|nr:hypothetical protein [Rhodoferax sp.]